MFRTKICGITNVDDAQAVAAAGADAVGLNFFPGSPRFCTLAKARKIVQALPPQICRVGVFVNATEQEIRSRIQELGLNLVQLHGDEPVELLKSLRGVPIMRAFRPGDDFSPLSNYLTRCHVANCVPRMLLIDACQPGQYGGTGATLDWELLAKNRPRLTGLPLVLAGGLKPANVAQAILAVEPWAVDTASGVETSPGKKSQALITEFVEAAKAAFKGLNQQGPSLA